MTRPTLANGDIWSASLANASITPFIAPTTEEADAAGGIPPVTDDQLSSTPGQLKSNFYGWRDRIKATVSAGLTVSYTGGSILLPGGTVATLDSGNIIIPNNATNFIYVNSSGAVTVAPSLPDVCFPLALAVASSGNITSFTDIRYQVVDQVSPINLASVQSPWSPGDVKHTFRQTAEAGWLMCHGQSLLVSEYPALFNAIGYSFGGSAGTFLLPDCRGRHVIGAGQGAGLSSRTYGSYGGAESRSLTVAELPSHSHGVSDPGHIHSVTDPGHTHVAIDGGHSHTIQDPGHQHSINDPGHHHQMATQRGAALNDDPTDGVGAELSTQGEGAYPATDSRTTGISVRTGFTGISMSTGYAPINVATSNARVSVNNAFAGISIQNQGGNAPINMMNPFVVGNYMIKY